MLHFEKVFRNISHGTYTCVGGYIKRQKAVIHYIPTHHSIFSKLEKEKALICSKELL